MSTFRITTNGMFRNYRTNLSKNNKRLNDTMTTVQTERKFNTYAEDPAAASKAFRLRRSYWLTEDQIDNNN
jgi:flagellar hook-associated protein 3 FlgL